MAKNGFQVMDSDLHTMEPDGLWEQYSRRAVQEVRAALHARRGERAEPAGDQDRRPRASPRCPSGRAPRWSARTSSSAPSRATRTTRSRTRAATTPSPTCRPWTSRASTSAVLYGTRGRQVLMHDDHDPAGGAPRSPAPTTTGRATSAQHDPQRLKFAAQLAFHDVPGAIAEARRAVRELGAVAVIGNPNPINGRHVHDPALRAAVGGHRGARRAGRLPSHRPVVAPRRHRAALPRHARTAASSAWPAATPSS